MYKLWTPTMGVVHNDGKRATIALPAGALLKVISENLADGTVDVMYNQQCIRMFALDLQQRGQRIDHIDRVEPGDSPD